MGIFRKKEAKTKPKKGKVFGDPGIFDLEFGE